MTPLDISEITDLAGRQPVIRALVLAAFGERLPDVAVECEFHRGWNGGWRVRATADGRPALDFAVLQVSGELVVWPVPFPAGWRARGVAGGNGGRYGVSPDGDVTRLP